MKRVPSMFQAIGSAGIGEHAFGNNDGTNIAQDSDDEDESDTSIPAFRPDITEKAERGGNIGILGGSRGAGTGSPRGRGRSRKSNI